MIISKNRHLASNLIKIYNLDIISKMLFLPCKQPKSQRANSASLCALSDKARHEPVIITKHGRDSLVVMSVEEWERLKRRDRTVGRTTELPEEWVEAVREAKVPASA